MSYAQEAAKVLKTFAPGFVPQVGIVLGSGLGPIADLIDPIGTINYHQLPGFPHSTIAGHHGQAVLGKIEEVSVVCLQGRAHFYEGYHHTTSNLSYEMLMTPVRTLKLLGCQSLLLTNSAGSLHPEVGAGSLVIIKDHINFQGRNPLIGRDNSEFGARFVDMENAYHPGLRQQLMAAGAESNVPLTEGIYVAMLGPTFETPAEIRALRILGGDVVGMSTVSEVITARHCDLQVAAISVITNLAAGMSDLVLDHTVTLQGAAKATNTLKKLLHIFFKNYPTYE